MRGYIRCNNTHIVKGCCQTKNQKIVKVLPDFCCIISKLLSMYSIYPQKNNIRELSSITSTCFGCWGLIQNADAGKGVCVVSVIHLYSGVLPDTSIREVCLDPSPYFSF